LVPKIIIVSNEEVGLASLLSPTSLTPPTKKGRLP
jgi:hypothetical protein